MEIIEKIKKELEEFNAKKVALVEELRTQFPLLLKPLFDLHPEVENISWTQYTPYFNDGDSCEFGWNGEEPDINGQSYWEYEGDEKLKAKSTMKDFSEILCAVPEEFYEDLFGDHVQVTINRDGTIDVDEYDHD